MFAAGITASSHYYFNRGHPALTRSPFCTHPRQSTQQVPSKALLMNKIRAWKGTIPSDGKSFHIVDWQSLLSLKAQKIKKKKK